MAGRGLALGLGLAVGAVTLPCRAAAAGAPVHTLTLAQAVQLALANNPDSKSADEDVHAAEGALTQSHAFDNPSLFASSLGRELSPFDSPVPNQFGVTWTVPIGGKRGAGIAQAHADLDAARATRVFSRRQLQLAVVTAFITVLLDQAQLDFGRQDAAGLHQAERINELRYKDGKISYGDVLKLRIQVRGADDAVRQDQLTLADDRADLFQLLGEGVLAADVRLAGTLAPPAATENLAPIELYRRALQNRTDYRAAQAGEKSAGASVSQARRTPIPDLDVLFDYNREPDTSGSYDVQLAVSIPLFDRNQGATRQAQAGYRKARLATESLRLADPRRRAQGGQGLADRPRPPGGLRQGSAGGRARVTRHHPPRLRARARHPARIPGRRGQLSRGRAGLSRGGGRRDAGRRPGALRRRRGSAMNPSRLVLLLSLLLSAMLIPVAGCAGSGEDAAPSASHPPASLFEVPAAQRAHLKLVTVLKKQVVRPVVVPALVAFDDLKTSEVTPLVSGKVARVLVHEGDKVKVGQALLSIASPDSSDNAANLSRDRSELRTKQTILARDEDLYQHKAISLEELQQARLDVESARTTVQNDETHMAITGSKSGDALLRSPIAGVVVSRQVAVGDAVSAESHPVLHHHRSHGGVGGEPAVPGGPAAGRAGRHRPGPLAGAR